MPRLDWIGKKSVVNHHCEGRTRPGEQMELFQP